MLIAIFTILFLGGGTSGLLDYIAQTEDNIKVVMEKDDRRKAALATVKEMKRGPRQGTSRSTDRARN